MIIVIDLSRKLVGYNLFQSFFYDLKSKGTLVFANNPLTVDDKGIDFNALKENISNLLYDRHASLWSLCVLYDMNDQKDDPIRNSISANIHDIKENIIKPLSIDYSFDKLYYFSLDNIRRSYDDIPAEPNINFAIDFDSMGYVKDLMISDYLDIVLSEREIIDFDLTWTELKEKYVSSDQITISKPKEVMAEITKKVDCVFDAKINTIKGKYPDLIWYAERLNKVKKVFCANFESLLYKNANSVNSIDNPSKLLKNALKMEVSTYREYSAVILHVDLRDKTSTLNREILKFRHQLEIISVLIYLATNDTKLIFEGGQTVGRENHWEISTVLDDKNLSKMLYSYNSKLKTELDKLGKFAYNEIEYEEFAPRTFNLSMEMKKPKLPPTPSIGMFARKHESRNVESFANDLYRRYLEGISYANKRMRELTMKLRVQKESTSNGKVKKANVIEITAELEKMRTEIKGLHQKLAFYRPKESISVNKNIKKDYDSVVERVAKLLKKRIKASTFFNNLFLIAGVSLCTYPILQLLGVPDSNTFWISVAMLVVPAGLYSLLQIGSSVLLRKEITKELQGLIRNNERTVNDLFENDNEASKYVQDIYNLIMQKKYVNECNAKVITSNRKLKQFNYHHDKLKEHAETSDRLIELLGIDIDNSESIQLDKMDGVEGGKNVETNPLYCPLSYLLLADPIKNKAVINGEQTMEIDSNLIGFVDKFIISHDKEYRHD